jgi:hypothetical protein
VLQWKKLLIRIKEIDLKNNLQVFDFLFLINLSELTDVNNKKAQL